MVSTYFSYNSVMRNFKQAMTRVAQQPDVARNAAYYKDHIGKVKTVDDFMGDYRLYTYAMKAYGLEDMTYAKAFMKKVLESDLSKPDSFANKLTDKRYREFAAAFSFNGTETPAAQSASQTDEMVGLYTATVKRQVEAIDEDTAYYNLAIADVQSVDDLLNNDRLRAYVFSALGIDDTQWSRDTITKVLGSDNSDPASYVNTEWVSRLDGIDDQVVQAQAILADASAKITDYMTQLAQPGADVNELRARIAVEKSRYAKSTSDIQSANDAITMIGRYVDLAGAFEFLSDGTLAAGVSAQTDANRATMNSMFVTSKGAVLLSDDEDIMALNIKQFRTNVAFISSVEAFVSTPNVYNFALKAVGLDPETASVATIKAVLESDPNDPKSFVHTLKDDRYLQLARAFNFDGNGNLTTPLVAQDTTEAKQIAKDYIIATTKFTSGTEQAALRAKADKDAIYYVTTMAEIDSVSDLLANRKMMDILLVARGLQPEKITTDFLKKIFNSDLTDPKSFANTQTDPRFAEIVASFNFGKDGKVARLGTIGPQKRDQLLETQNKYLQQNLETQQGEANPGVRLALYFQRKAASITSAYDILADKALAEVFRTTFKLPDTFGAMPVDQQAKVVEKFLKLKDLTDPAKLDKLLGRFAVMYEMKTNAPSTPAALSILQGSQNFIGESTFQAIARLGRR